MPLKLILIQKKSQSMHFTVKYVSGCDKHVQAQQRICQYCTKWSNPIDKLKNPRRRWKLKHFIMSLLRSYCIRTIVLCKFKLVLIPIFYLVKLSTTKSSTDVIILKGEKRSLSRRKKKKAPVHKGLRKVTVQYVAQIRFKRDEKESSLTRNYKKNYR